MTDMNELKKAVEKKYIEPIRRPAKPWVGIEFEFPVVNLRDEEVDFGLVHRMINAFADRFDFSSVERDDDGEIYLAIQPDNDDTISGECSYNTIEFSFGVTDNMCQLYDTFTEYYTFVQDFLAKEDHMLTGMGINPNFRLNRNIPVPNYRYRMLFHHLQSYCKYGDTVRFHNFPEFGLFSGASQVQLDVEEANVIEVINTFSRLEPLKALLFANSLFGDYLCSRDFLWRRSLHGLNPHNLDMYEEELHSIDELVEYIMSMSLYCLDRDGKYINFPPTPLKEYFSNQENTGEFYDGSDYRAITFEPKLSDLEYLRSFKFEDLTHRGTVEFRSVCEQPLSQVMSPAAYHTGLLRKLPELTGLLDDDCIMYRDGSTPVQLRREFVKKGTPKQLDQKAYSRLLLETVDLAAEGLRERGHGEEKFLEPLYERAETLISPAEEMLEGLDREETMQSYIKKFAELPRSL